VPAFGEIEPVPRARRALALAVDEVRSLGHGRVGTEHILLGLAREGQGVAAGILDRLGIDLEQLRQRKLPALSQAD
jgi:ATP-dependent Clp protease ATP-binding subunit ClpC